MVKTQQSTQNYTIPSDDQKHGRKCLSKVMKQFFYHLDPDTRKVTRRLEKIVVSSWCNG